VQWLAALLVVLAIDGTPRLILAAPQCVSPPGGLIAWWPGDGDATDIAGHHNGTLQNGASFGTGEVGQTFQFDASQHQYVDVDTITLPVTFTIRRLN
jgi:hypothetical protein